jgi:diguanylate cyclase (GGDEF)-like protein
VGQLEFASGLEKLTVTISIGIAGYPSDGDDAQGILNRADDALYRAKDNGRNCVIVSSTDDTEGSAKVHVLPVKNAP